MRTFNHFLLEKDHRRNMLKFSISQEVADYLHNFNDKYSIWFANQFKEMEAFQNSRDQVNWIRTRMEDNMTGIIDWVTTVPNTMLKNYGWDQAVEAQENYHNNLEVNSLEGVENNTIIKQYDDGMYWVDLESTNCPAESSAMGHCGSTSAETMFSLRKYDKATNSVSSHVTIAANPEGQSWQQAKGRNNSIPKEEYHYYIAHILVDYEMLAYKHEYSSDFNAEDLQEYIETHPDEFKDPDDLISNIDGNLTKVEEFEKILADADLTNIHIDVEESYEEERYVYMRGGIYEEISFESLGTKYIDFDNISGTYDGICDRIENLLSVTFEEFTFENGYNTTSSFIMSGNFNMDYDSMFTMDADGLESFERVIQNYEYCQSNYDADEITDIIKYGLSTSRIIETEYTKFVDDIIDNIDDYDNIDLSAEEEPVEDGMAQFHIESGFASTPLENFIQDDPLFAGYVPITVLYNKDIPNHINNTMTELKILGNPLYHLYKYLKDSLVRFNDIIVEYKNGTLNFKYEINTDDITNNEEYNKYRKIFDYFTKNIQSIQSEVNELINTKIAPFIDTTQYMDISDVTYSLSNSTNPRGFIIIRANGSKLTIGRVPIGLSYTHKNFTEYDIKDDKTEIEGLVSRHLKTSELKKYSKGESYDPKQMLMSFEAYCKR